MFTTMCTIYLNRSTNFNCITDVMSSQGDRKMVHVVIESGGEFLRGNAFLLSLSMFFWIKQKLSHIGRSFATHQQLRWSQKKTNAPATESGDNSCNNSLITCTANYLNTIFAVRKSAGTSQSRLTRTISKRYNNVQSSCKNKTSAEGPKKLFLRNTQESTKNNNRCQTVKYSVHDPSITIIIAIRNLLLYLRHPNLKALIFFIIANIKP